MQCIGDDHRFDEIELHGYPPYPATFTLYDDDGHTRNYQQGEFCTTECRITAGGAEGPGSEEPVRVVIEQTVGRYPKDAKPRRVTVVLHRSAAPREVRVNHASWPNWEHDSATQTVRVSVDCPCVEATTIEVCS